MNENVFNVFVDNNLLNISNDFLNHSLSSLQDNLKIEKPVKVIF